MNGKAMGPFELLLLSITLFAILINCQLQATEDTFIVECNSDNPCAAQIVTDCQENDKQCIIDCTKGENICKDAEFFCHENKDCTLICDSTNATKSCDGTILNATKSSDINVKVLCLNTLACEYIIIDTNTTNINLNITIQSNDIYDVRHSQNIAKHGIVYLPQSGDVYMQCYGHSVCHSMQIYGNTSIDTSLQLKINGLHSFKDSYLSFPSDSDIEIICGDAGDHGNIDIIDGSCYQSTFDGTQSGQNSDINIECHGDDSCFDIIVVANKLSKSLMIDARNGDNILSKADIYCPSSLDNGNIDEMSNCEITVYGNGTKMLVDTSIHTYDGFNDVNLECDYTSSITLNCYTNQQSGPTLYCYDDDDDQQRVNNESCRLILSEAHNQWKCLDDDLLICETMIIEQDDNDQSNDFESNQLSILTTLDMIDDNEDDDDDYFNDTEIVETIGIDGSIKDIEDEIGLLHNRKGQIVLSTIILILLSLCVAVCYFKRDGITEWMESRNPMDQSQGGGDHNIDGMYHDNGIMHIGGTKNKYASLDEVEDQSEEELINENDQSEEELTEDSN